MTSGVSRMSCMAPSLIPSSLSLYLFCHVTRATTHLAPRYCLGRGEHLGPLSVCCCLNDLSKFHFVPQQFSCFKCVVFYLISQNLFPVIRFSSFISYFFEEYLPVFAWLLLTPLTDSNTTDTSFPPPLIDTSLADLRTLCQLVLFPGNTSVD